MYIEMSLRGETVYIIFFENFMDLYHIYLVICSDPIMNFVNHTLTAIKLLRIILLIKFHNPMLRQR